MLQTLGIAGGVLRVDGGDPPGVHRQRFVLVIEDHTEIAGLIRGLIGDRRESIVPFALKGIVIEIPGTVFEVVLVELLVEAILVGKCCRMSEAFDDALVFLRDTVREIASVVRHQIEDEVGVGPHAAEGHEVERAHDEQQCHQNGEDRHMDEPFADPFDHALSSSE